MDEFNIDEEEIHILLEHLLFVNIIVDKEMYGYQIFENLNSKGITLSNVDIIKNGLFSRIPDDKHVSPHQSTKYLKWKEIENNMMNFSDIDLKILDRVKNEFSNNLEDMMKFYVQCKTNKKSLTKSNYGISSAYIEFLDRETSSNIQNELFEMADYSRYAKYVFYPKINIHSYTITKRINRYFNAIETLNVKQHRHMSISFVRLILLNKCCNLEKDIIDFYKKLVLFHYLFNTISSEIPSKISRVYLDSALTLYKDSISESAIKNAMEDVLIRFNANIPSKTIINQKISETIFYVKEDIGKQIEFDKKEYKIYEGKYYGLNIFEILESSYEENVREINIESIEHLLNQSQIVDNFENFKLYSMLPLEASINTEMGRSLNMPISIKIEYLRRSKYHLTKEFVRFFDSDFFKFSNDVKFVISWKARFVDIIFDVYNKLYDKSTK